VTARPDPTPEQLHEAIRDLTGILRAMYAASRDETHRRPALVTAARRLAELDAVLGTEPQCSPAYVQAMRAAEQAVNAVLGGLHFNASLQPALGAAVGRALPRRGR
jgi:hypothetical protein